MASIKKVAQLVVGGIITASFATSMFFKYYQGVDIPTIVIIGFGFVSGYLFAGDVSVSTPAFSISAEDEED